MHEEHEINETNESNEINPTNCDMKRKQNLFIYL
jgi:hypothetical protein